MNTTRRVLPEIKLPGADSRVSSSAAYLTELNREQRAAVEHGVEDGGSKPLLVIAGAGSGKTKTLAHRVAHLIVNGADPRRILLLTFSRRSAAELTRRVLRISTQCIGHARRCPDRRLDVGWYVPWHWRTALAGVSRSDWAQPHIHDP